MRPPCDRGAAVRRAPVPLQMALAVARHPGPPVRHSRSPLRAPVPRLVARNSSPHHTHTHTGRKPPVPSRPAGTGSYAARGLGTPRGGCRCSSQAGLDRPTTAPAASRTWVRTKLALRLSTVTEPEPLVSSLAG